MVTFRTRWRLRRWNPSVPSWPYFFLQVEDLRNRSLVRWIQRHFSGENLGTPKGHIWLVVWNISLFFHSVGEFHHPKWRSPYFSEGKKTTSPDIKCPVLKREPPMTPGGSQVHRHSITPYHSHVSRPWRSNEKKNKLFGADFFFANPREWLDGGPFSWGCLTMVHMNSGGFKNVTGYLKLDDWWLKDRFVSSTNEGM